MTGEPSTASSSTPPPVDPRWRIVVPVKEAGRAKSRLAPPDPLSRPDLARSVARDTLEQVCRALRPTQVTVVTSDPQAREVAERLGASVVGDPGGGLDAAVLAGLGAAGEPGSSPHGAAGSGSWPHGAGGTEVWLGVLLGDLPALTAAELMTALAECARHTRAVVPDAAGTGTVLLTSTDGPPEPAFGPGSAQRHAQGATLLDLDLPRLRRDVDTWADLSEALALGVGPATRTALTPLA